MVRKIWLGRNKVLQQQEDEADKQIYFMEAAELWHYHSIPTLIPTSDQLYCHNITLTNLLHSWPSVIQWWLWWVRTEQAAYLDDGDNQQNVTWYMAAIQLSRGDGFTTRRASGQQDSTSSNSTARTSNATQQWMTASSQDNPQFPPTPHTQNPLPSSHHRNAYLGWVPHESLQ